MTHIGDLSGVGPVEYVTKVTHEEVGKRYKELMDKFLEVFNKRSADNPNYEFTAADYEEMKKAYEGLIDLAQNGLVIDGKVYYLNNSMIGGIEMLMEVLALGGLLQLFQGGDANLTPDELAQKMDDWWLTAPNLTKSGLERAQELWVTWQAEMTQAMAVLMAAFKGANGVLSDLKTAGEQMQKMLEMLTDLQYLMNKKEPVLKEGIKIPEGLTPEQYLADLLSKGEAYYGDAIEWKSTATAEDRTSFQTMMKGLEEMVKQLVDASGIGPDSPNYKGSPSEKAQTLLDSMKAAGDLDTWILDQGFGSYESGDILHLLQTTTTAFQTFNTQHTSDIQQQLLFIEEISKMISSALQVFQNMVTSAARNVRGG